MADEAVYNALPVGEYRFEVRTMDRDGLLSEVASLEVQILPDAKTERIHAFENVLRATDHVVHSQSWAMRHVMEQTVHVAETAMTVLVLGETGTGKGLLAQTIHETSTRRKRPFHPRQLRGAAGWVGGKRVVRPREGGLYRGR